MFCVLLLDTGGSRGDVFEEIERASNASFVPRQWPAGVCRLVLGELRGLWVLNPTYIWAWRLSILGCHRWAKLQISALMELFPSHVLTFENTFAQGISWNVSFINHTDSSIINGWLRCKVSVCMASEVLWSKVPFVLPVPSEGRQLWSDLGTCMPSSPCRGTVCQDDPGGHASPL